MSSENDNLIKLLKEKENQYNELQTSYNDYVESSAALEQELQKTLDEALVKLANMTEKEKSATKIISELEKKVAFLKTDNTQKVNLIRNYESSFSANNVSMSNMDDMKDRVKQLENENENLLNQVRILEASEVDVNDKLSRFEEESIMLKSDVEFLTSARYELEETVKEYEKKLASNTVSVNNNNSTISDDAKDKGSRDDGTTKLLEKKDREIESLKVKLSGYLTKNLSDMKMNIPEDLKLVVQQRDKEVEGLKAKLITLIDEKDGVAVEQLRKDQMSAQMISKQQEELSTLRSELKNAQSEINTLMNEKKSLAKEQCLFCSEKVAQSNKTIDKLNDDIKVLTASLTNRAIELDRVKRYDRSPSTPIQQSLSIDTQFSVHQMSDIVNTKIVNGSYGTAVNKAFNEVLDTDNIDTVKDKYVTLSRKYESIQSANIKLLSRVQSMVGSIQVCCRTRPASDRELANKGNICVDTTDDNELLCYDTRAECWKSYCFDKVWPMEANQSDIFSDVEPVAISCLDGYNACIFAYGQTGSGKTFTMDGDGDQYGVSYRTIQKLLDILQLRKLKAIKENNRKKKFSDLNLNNAQSPKLSKKKATNTFTFGSTDNDDDIFNYSITISMMEIYNEQVYDLLNANQGGGKTDGVSLDIRQDADNQTSVPGLQQIPVSSLNDVMTIFSKGASNRATAATNLNEHSSRSHLIIQINVTSQHESGIPTSGKLFLVDLAGSERVLKSGVTGAGMKEAQHINKSLSALGDVMEALDQKSKYIPYRNSKLTYLLQSSLSGNSRTMMIVTVCPTDLTFDETLFTLQFATRVRNITLGPTQKQSHTKNLEVTIKSLRVELKEAKRGKTTADEALHELRKEIKKMSALGSNAVDSKNKNLEEAKRTADIVMQQLNKQLSEVSMKYSEEKTMRENCHGDLIVCQKSLRKALDEIRDFGKKEEAWSQVIIKKDAEIDKLKTIVENVSANINRGIHSSARRVAPTSSSGLLSAPKRNIRSKAAAASSIAPSTISGSTLESPPKKDNRSQVPRSPYERLSTTLTASAISHFEAAERERIEKEEKRDEKAREAAGIGIEKQTKFTNTYVNPKGHRSWLDAMGPTASRVAATEIEYSGGGGCAPVGSNGIPRPHMNRSLLQNSPTKSSSSKGSPIVGTSPSVPLSPFERDTESSAQRKAAAATKFQSRSNSFDHLLSTDTPLKTTGSSGSSGGGGGGGGVDDGQNKNETNSLTYTTATEQTGNSFMSPPNAKELSIVIDSPHANHSPSTNSPKVNQSPSTESPMKNQSPTINTPTLRRSQNTYSIQVDEDSPNDDTNYHHFQTVDSPMTLQSGGASEMITSSNNFTSISSPRKKEYSSSAQTGGGVNAASSKKRFSTSGATGGGSLVLNPQSRYPTSTTKYNYANATAATLSKSRKDIMSSSSGTNDPFATAYKETTIDDSQQQQQQQLSGQQQYQHRREDPLSAIRRVPIISARSEEAMRKHQARMVKKKEMPSKMMMML